MKLGMSSKMRCGVKWGKPIENETTDYTDYTDERKPSE